VRTGMRSTLPRRSLGYKWGYKLLRRTPLSIGAPRTIGGIQLKHGLPTSIARGSDARKNVLAGTDPFTA
jgi:hypothetical protein